MKGLVRQYRLTKFRNSVLQILLAAGFAVAPSTLVSAQSTWTCTSPKWDILQIMRMQTTWAEDGYYLSGTNQSGGTVYMYQAASDVTYNSTNEWTGGQLHYIKNYKEPPANPPDPQKFCTTNCSPYVSPAYAPEDAAGTPEYWGYPADVDLFDTSYIYLWVTEIDWNNPYAYKKFNSNNSNYSFPFAPRCAVPGQTTIKIPEPSGNTVPTTTIPSTAYAILPSNAYSGSLIDTSNEAFTSADCTNGSSWQDLGYAFTQVNAAKTGFAMTNKVNSTTPSLNYLPIVYWYECNSSYGSCGNHEEFDYGYDSSTGDYYGLVQWLHFTGTSQTPDETATFNTMQQYTGADNGSYSYTNLTFPGTGCPD
jgi:hypothetical protein